MADTKESRLMRSETKYNVMVATPASGGMLTAAYVHSLFDLKHECALRRPDINIALQISQFSLLDKARNVSASNALANQSITHLLFIDADQGYSPSLIFDMIDFDKPVTSVVNPKRHLDVSDVHQRARNIDAIEDFKRKYLQFVYPGVIRQDDGGIRVVQGFIRVVHIGTAIMLIRRDALERLAQDESIVARKGAEGIPEMVSGDYLQCFRPVIKHDNTPMSEDASFCHRWVYECGGEIWANIVHEITHVGTHGFRGKFIDQFRN